MNTKIQACLANLENGNLKDAKRQAKRITTLNFLNYMNEAGYDPEWCLNTVNYVKGMITFEQYCERKYRK